MKHLIYIWLLVCCWQTFAHAQGRKKDKNQFTEADIGTLLGAKKALEHEDQHIRQKALDYITKKPIFIDQLPDQIIPSLFPLISDGSTASLKILNQKCDSTELKKNWENIATSMALYARKGRQDTTFYKLLNRSITTIPPFFHKFLTTSLDSNYRNFDRLLRASVVIPHAAVYFELEKSKYAGRDVIKKALREVEPSQQYIQEISNYLTSDNYYQSKLALELLDHYKLLRYQQVNTYLQKRFSGSDSSVKDIEFLELLYRNRQLLSGESIHLLVASLQQQQQRQRQQLLAHLKLMGTPRWRSDELEQQLLQLLEYEHSDPSESLRHQTLITIGKIQADYPPLKAAVQERYRMDADTLSHYQALLTLLRIAPEPALYNEAIEAIQTILNKQEGKSKEQRSVALGIRKGLLKSLHLAPTTSTRAIANLLDTMMESEDPMRLLLLEKLLPKPSFEKKVHIHLADLLHNGRPGPTQQSSASNKAFAKTIFSILLNEQDCLDPELYVDLVLVADRFVSSYNPDGSKITTSPVRKFTAEEADLFLNKLFDFPRWIHETNQHHILASLPKLNIQQSQTLRSLLFSDNTIIRPQWIELIQKIDSKLSGFRTQLIGVLSNPKYFAYDPYVSHGGPAFHNQELIQRIVDYLKENGGLSKKELVGIFKNYSAVQKKSDHNFNLLGPLLVSEFTFAALQEYPDNIRNLMVVAYLSSVVPDEDEIYPILELLSNNDSLLHWQIRNHLEPQIAPIVTEKELEELPRDNNCHFWTWIIKITESSSWIKCDTFLKHFPLEGPKIDCNIELGISLAENQCLAEEMFALLHPTISNYTVRPYFEEHPKLLQSYRKTLFQWLKQATGQPQYNLLSVIELLPQLKEEEVNQLQALLAADDNYAYKINSILRNRQTYSSTHQLDSLLGVYNWTFDTLAYVDALSNFYKNEGSNSLLIYATTGGQPAPITLLNWAISDPATLSMADRRSILHLLVTLWKHTENYPLLKDNWSTLLAFVSDRYYWRKSDLSRLRQAQQILAEEQSPYEKVVSKSIQRGERLQRIYQIISLIALHIITWILLLFVFYPRSAKLQALLFWNPYMRKVFGLFYIDYLLLAFPIFRRQLFQPFKAILQLKSTSFNPDSYYLGSKISLKQEDSQGSKWSIHEFAQKAKGAYVLEGHSGVGKTLYLQYRSQYSKNIVIHLQATDWGQGIFHWLSNRLEGKASDKSFLNKLITAGAFDLYIDGLNEVGASVRADIERYLEQHPKNNIVLTTQPINWIHPPQVDIYQLHPLDEEQQLEFLISRKQELSDVPGDWEQRCHRYLRGVYQKIRNLPEGFLIKQSLENPMDLSLLAQLLAKHPNPDPWSIVSSFHEELAQVYRRRSGLEFRIDAFAKFIYSNWKTEHAPIPIVKEFADILELMATPRFRILTTYHSRETTDKSIRQYRFRHERFANFYIARHFLNKPALQKEHLQDIRFRGVYLRLAHILPIEAAIQLDVALREAGSKHNFHSIDHPYYLILSSREDYPYTSVLHRFRKK